MSCKIPSIKDLTNMINGVMGHEVLTEEKLEQIIKGAKKANEEGGMSQVLDYLIKVTQADVSKDDLQEFAEKVKSDPSLGMDILLGKKKINKENKK